MTNERHVSSRFHADRIDCARRSLQIHRPGHRVQQIAARADIDIAACRKHLYVAILRRDEIEQRHIIHRRDRDVFPCVKISHVRGTNRRRDRPVDARDRDDWVFTERVAPARAGDADRRDVVLDDLVDIAGADRPLTDHSDCRRLLSARSRRRRDNDRDCRKRVENTARLHHADRLDPRAVTLLNEGLRRQADRALLRDHVGIEEDAARAARGGDVTRPGSDFPGQRAREETRDRDISLGVDVTGRHGIVPRRQRDVAIFGVQVVLDRYRLQRIDCNISTRGHSFDLCESAVGYDVDRADLRAHEQSIRGKIEVARLAGDGNVALHGMNLGDERHVLARVDRDVLHGVNHLHGRRPEGLRDHARDTRHGHQRLLVDRVALARIEHHDRADKILVCDDGGIGSPLLNQLPALDDGRGHRPATATRPRRCDGYRHNRRLIQHWTR